MAAGYCATGKHQEIASFEVSIRRLPRDREWVLVAGIEQAVDYLLNLSYTADELRYLRGLKQLANAPEEFFAYLERFRFSGDVDAVPEGTVLFAGEPLMTVRAPIFEAQIPETYLLSAITFPTLIATKAARMVDAAAGRTVVEFGTRRAHTPEAGTIGARAAYIGGCSGTSNTLAGYRYGIPVLGTSAHSWVMSFASETEAFRSLQKLLGDQTVQLIDTYDTLEGARKAAQLGRPLWGVRIDSGDLSVLAREVRRILDAAGLRDSKIMASGDLDEYSIQKLITSRTPIDAFGVGTELATSGDAPSMGMIYKMVEIEENGHRRLPAKRSSGKPSMPGEKQIWRFEHHDVVSLSGETIENGVPLLRPFVRDGRRVRDAESLDAMRLRGEQSRRSARAGHRIERSIALGEVVRETLHAQGISGR